MAASPIYGQTGRGVQGHETAIASQERHTDSLLANPDVVGTAVGLGAEGRAAVFVFTVEEGVAGIPTELDGVPVVTRVTGEVPLATPPPPLISPRKTNGLALYRCPNWPLVLNFGAESIR